jgi:hypothetical protein
MEIPKIFDNTGDLQDTINELMLLSTRRRMEWYKMGAIKNGGTTNSLCLRMVTCPVKLKTKEESPRGMCLSVTFISPSEWMVSIWLISHLYFFSGEK